MGCCAPHTNGSTGGNTPGGSAKVFQRDSLASLLTSSASYVTLHTTADVTEMKNGEEWKINWCVGVCHPISVTSQNTQVRLLVETATNVFTEIDSWQVAWGIVISGGISCPAHRTLNVVASMDDPRFQFQVR